MNNTILIAMSDLYTAAGRYPTVASDPSLAPVARATLRATIDRLYVALESPVDRSNAGDNLRLRVLAGSAATHGEALLTHFAGA